MLIKVIAFDVGGVLAIARKKFAHEKSESKSVHALVANKLGIDLDGYFDAIDTTWSASIDGRISKSEALKIMSHNLRTNPEKLERVFIEAYHSVYERNDYLYNAAYNLKSKFKIMILSDQWPVSKEVTVNFEDEKKFDYSIISCEVGVRKPDSKIYGIALERAGVKPNELVFIDNRDWNTIAAEALGIKTILFESNEQCIQELRKIGVVV